jgi:hypothetical protein
MYVPMKVLQKTNPEFYDDNAFAKELFFSLLKGKPFWIQHKNERKAADEKY